MRRKFANTKLKAHEDPDEYLMNLEVLAMEINAMDSGTSDMTDMDIMSHALCNLPADYDAIADGLERQLEAKGDEKLTIDKLREKLNARFTRLGELGRDEEDESYTPEQALVAINQFKRRFKGTCYRCGKRGHKSVDCHERKKDESGNVAVDDDESDEEELGF